MHDADTITAIATAAGRGGIGIVRVSGAKAASIAETITHQSLSPRAACFGHFHINNESIDSGIVLYFPGPASFTGEDVVELQCHGSPVVLDMLVKEVCRLGARMARPGEFSERAFLNDKLDLAQAEAIADLIESSTELAARNASRSLQGEFSREIDRLVTLVTELRVYVEASIDFPEEEIDFLAEGHVEQRLNNIKSQFLSVLSSARLGSLIREGMNLVIVGKPNAGKSSLLNALAGQERAIVTAQAGTTRDLLREHIQIDGIPLHIVDTAGLRQSKDVIEQEGIRRAKKEMANADRILLVVDASDLKDIPADLSQMLPSDEFMPSKAVPLTVIMNKCDLSGHEPHMEETEAATLVTLSAKTGAGLTLLQQHLKACMGYESDGQGNFSARRRHLTALEQALNALDNGLAQLAGNGAGELLAEDLKLCQQYLGEITGAFTNDQLLGEIFSNFCIGK